MRQVDLLAEEGLEDVDISCKLFGSLSFLIVIYNTLLLFELPSTSTAHSILTTKTRIFSYHITNKAASEQREN